eukprot:gene875-8500_t
MLRRRIGNGARVKVSDAATLRASIGEENWQPEWYVACSGGKRTGRIRRLVGERLAYVRFRDEEGWSVSLAVPIECMYEAPEQGEAGEGTGGAREQVDRMKETWSVGMVTGGGGASEQEGRAAAVARAAVASAVATGTGTVPAEQRQAELAERQPVAEALGVAPGGEQQRPVLELAADPPVVIKQASWRRSDLSIFKKKERRGGQPPMAVAKQPSPPQARRRPDPYPNAHRHRNPLRCYVYTLRRRECLRDGGYYAPLRLRSIWRMRIFTWKRPHEEASDTRAAASPTATAHQTTPDPEHVTTGAKASDRDARRGRLRGRERMRRGHLCANATEAWEHLLLRECRARMHIQHVQREAATEAATVAQDTRRPDRAAEDLALVCMVLVCM